MAPMGKSIQMRKEFVNEFDWSMINYSHLLSKFNKGLLLIDPEGIIVEANEFTYKILGTQLLIGRPFTKFVNNDELLLFSKRMQQLLDSDESEFSTILNLKKECGDTTAVRLSATYTVQLESNAIVIFFEDIEENITLEHELNNSNYILDMFAYRASHDLRGPIATIKGLCNVMSIQQKNSSNLYIDLIAKECKKMESRVNRLSEISALKKESKRTVLLDFDQIIKSVTKSLRLGLNFNIQVENSIRSNFYSSPVYIMAIFYHLLENAKRFRKRDKSLHEISINLYEQENAGIYIMLKDAGIGIETDELSKIFDIFYRGDSKYAGSGIGLYLVQDIVQKLKGKIKVVSKLKYYTSITIFLPFNY